MKELTPRGNPDAFFVRLTDTDKRLLLLDYDGTLAPFQVQRDQARPYKGVAPILDEIIAQGKTRLVIISGRWTRDLRPLLGMHQRPELWGCHGWERLWPDGRHEKSPLPRRIEQALDQAALWARGRGFKDQLECKPASVALHWRGLSPDAQAQVLYAGQQAWQPIAQRNGLTLHEFDGGLEMRFPGRDKGYAVRQLLAEEGPGTAVAYLGDDRTDEDAFCALQGLGLNILVRADWRSTAADLWLEPPQELLWFLRRWAEIDNKGG